MISKALLQRQTLNHVLRSTRTSPVIAALAVRRAVEQKRFFAWVGRLRQQVYMPAPSRGDGPLMERRSNRDLPDIEKMRFRWMRSLPIFLLIIAICSAAIFNYQKMTSSVVNSTLYALRTSPRARAILGNEIYFKQRIPWISGEMNQLHGRINIEFAVKGTKGEAVMRFASYRYTDRGQFETTEWSLRLPNGEVVDLLDGQDAMGVVLNTALELDEEDLAIQTRGFRGKKT